MTVSIRSRSRVNHGENVRTFLNITLKAMIVCQKKKNAAVLEMLDDSVAFP